MLRIFLPIGFILLLTAGLSLLFVRPKRVKEAVRVIKEGFRQGLRQCGLIVSKKTLPVELWKWETMHDEEVCEDCLERASWPAMDIADWMKEGLPRTLEAQTSCGHNCRCELVLHKPESQKTLL